MMRFAKTATFALLCAAMLGGSTGCAYTIPGNMESLASLVFSLGSGITIQADIAVTNMRDGGMTQSGFLNGTASAANLAAVEIAVGEGAYTEATGTDTWSWQLPTGPTGLRLGRTYTLNIRTRDFRGNYSEPISFTIKKDLNRDVNGDGYPDLLVSARAAAGDGRAYIFHGGSSGLGTRNASAADTIIIAEGGGFMSFHPVLADVNGDGFADAIIADPFNGAGNIGRVYVFHSRGTAGIASAGAASADTLITGDGTGIWFGFAAAAGDLNGDGYTDLAVGAAQGTEAIYLFHSGGSSGIASQNAGAASAVMTYSSGGSPDFGLRLGLGDINGDGFADLVAPARTGAGTAGEVYIFLTPGTALSSRNHTMADATITGEAASRLCEECLVKDLNGDGYADLALASDRYSSDTGRAYIFYSAGANGIATASAASASLIITGDAASAFGHSVAAGDIDGDGNMDLAIGSPHYPSPNDIGRAYVFYNITSLTSGTAATLAGTLLTGGVVGQRQAERLALLDLNGDGFDDVLTGSANTTTVVDEVHYFRAPGSGMIISQDLGSGGTAGAILDGETLTDRFGFGLAR